MRRDDNILFEDICDSLSKDKRLIAETKFGKGVTNLKFKWEGYHILKYASSIYDKGSKARIDFEGALDEREIKSGIAWIQRMGSAKSVHHSKVRKIFESLAKAQGVSLLACLLSFLEFCENNNRQLAVFNYDEKKLKGTIDGIKGYLAGNSAADANRDEEECKATVTAHGNEKNQVSNNNDDWCITIQSRLKKSHIYNTLVEKSKFVKSHPEPNFGTIPINQSSPLWYES